MRKALWELQQSRIHKASENNVGEDTWEPAASLVTISGPKWWAAYYSFHAVQPAVRVIISSLCNPYPLPSVLPIYACLCMWRVITFPRSQGQQLIPITALHVPHIYITPIWSYSEKEKAFLNMDTKDEYFACYLSHTENTISLAMDVRFPLTPYKSFYS